MGTVLSSKEIGWQLRKLRLQAGWTQEALSEAIGVTPQQIQNYESGANKLNTDRLQQLALALDVPIQSFFVSGDEPLPMSISEKLLIDSYRAIPNKDTQDSVLKVITSVARNNKT